MEPEHKIEKLLRAYAKKRRADAGDAFKLHPATRRMLQGEIARQTPKPDDEEESVSLWDLFRQRWAVLLGFALIIFFGATLFLPALSRAKMKSKNVEAMSSLKQLGAAVQIASVDNRGKLPATLDALTNQLVSADTLTDAVSGQRFVYVAGGKILNEMRTNDVLAYSPADNKDRAVLFADGSVQRVRRDEFSTLTNRTLLALAENAPERKLNEQPAPLEVATATPAAALPALVPPPPTLESAGHADKPIRAPATSPSSVSGTGTIAGELASANSAAANPRGLAAEKLAPAQNAATFKSELTANNFQLGMNNSQRYRQTVTAKMPPVLASFELQQNGDQVSVVDRDGSIYNGSLQLAVQDDLSKTRAAVAKPGASGLLKKDYGVAGNGNAQQAAQNYFFRVSGANRSLKQNIVFSGNLFPISNANANASQKFAGFGGGGGGGGQSKLADASAAQQQLFSNSRIEGTVTIGNTNSVQINAVPVSQ